MKLAICLTIFFALVAARAEWTPPTGLDPDLRSILLEAQTNTDAQKFEDAYKIYFWFNQHAFRVDPTKERIPWTNVLSHYIPSVDGMKAKRDGAEERLRGGETDYSRMAEDFLTVTIVNKTLGENIKTVELFRWLDTSEPNLVRRNYVYVFAMPILIEAKEYKLCAKYIDVKFWREQTFSAYEKLQILAKADGDIKERPNLSKFAQSQFCSRTEAQIAILVLSGQRAEAKKIVSEVENKFGKNPEFKNSKFKKQIDDALTGKPPEAWPSPWG